MVEVLGIAFGAGVLASLNPCAAAMLPAYVVFTLGTDSAGGLSVRARALRGAGLGLVMTGGFVVVFVLIGGALAVGLRQIVPVFPLLAVAVGAALFGLGVYVAAGGSFGARLGGAIAPTRTPGSVFSYGAAYGLASLGCTLPVFLAVVGSSLALSGLQRVLPFLAYAAGMGLLVVTLSVGATLARESVMRVIKGAARFFRYASGILIAAAGLYLAYNQVQNGVLGSALGADFLSQPLLVVAATATVGGSAGLVAISIRRRRQRVEEPSGTEVSRDLIPEINEDEGCACQPADLNSPTAEAVRKTRS